MAPLIFVGDEAVISGDHAYLLNYKQLNSGCLKAVNLSGYRLYSYTKPKPLSC